MLSANEANRIANNYQSHAKEKALAYLEKSIVARANDGLKWFPWSYDFSMEYEGLTENEKQEIIYELRSAGYDVKNNWLLGEITIRW